MALSYADKMMALKGIGYLKGMKTRKHFTSGEKSAISRLYKQNKPYLTHSQDFAVKTVSSKTASKIADAKIVGRGKTRTVIIRRIERGGRVKVRKSGKVEQEGIRYTITEFPLNRPEVFHTIERELAHPLARGEYLTVKIGADRPGSVRPIYKKFDSLDGLNEYMSNIKFRPGVNGRQRTMEEMLPHISIVKVHRDAVFLDILEDEDEDDNEEEQ